MTKSQLYQELKAVNHSKEKRAFYANMLISNPKLTPILLDIVFDVNDNMSPRAAWVLEFACKENIAFIIPYLETFTKNINTIYIDSAVRPAAKICEMIAKAYTSKTNHVIKKHLTVSQQKRIIETCFDYLISKQKVAAKAYGMVALFLLGKHHDWVHQELILILERDYSSQSAAYKARARVIFKKVKKNAF